MALLHFHFAVLIIVIGFCGWTLSDQSEGDCDFEGRGKNKFCRWTNAQSDNFDWSVGSSTPSGGTGPRGDHTTGRGNFAFIETSSPRRPDEKARLMSGPYVGAFCLHFSYSMVGQTIGSLSLLHLLGKKSIESSIWTKSGPQRGDWNSHNATVYGTNFYVAFEAEAGSSYTSDIAIDDIYFTNGSCHGESFVPLNDTIGKCSFDVGLCDWTNDLVASEYPWYLSSYRGKKNNAISHRDHGGRLRGKYLYAVRGRDRKTQSRLVSNPLCGSKCVEFFYFMEKTKNAELRVTLRDDFDEDRLWFLTGQAAEKKDWTRGLVEVMRANESKCYQLIFEADIGGTQKTLIGLDDIFIANGSCCPLTSTPEQVAKANCNFDDGSFCKWKHSPKTKFLWTIANGKTASGNLNGGLTGPSTDFSGNGMYAYIESSEPQYKGDAAILTSEVLSGQQCMSFKYHMFGDDIGTLSVYKRGFLVWQEKGHHGDQWLDASIEFDCSIPKYQITIEATVGGWRGDIAIDELHFTVGSCPVKVYPDVKPTTTAPVFTLPPLPPPYSTCTFSYDFCDWENPLDDDDDWIREHGETPSSQTGPHFDRDGHGYYAYMEATNMLKGQEVRLESREIAGPVCLTFYYHMFGKDIGELRIEQRNLTDNSTKTMWAKSGEQEDYWTLGLQEFYGERYKVTFVGVRGEYFHGDIGLDDIGISEVEECQVLTQASQAGDITGNPKEGNCDFENNQEKFCQWTNAKYNTAYGNTFQWLIGSGKTPSSSTGPEFDHTLGPKSRTGKYAFIEASSPRQRGHMAFLVVKVEGRALCMKFWYHMYGNNMGSLKLLKIAKVFRDDPQPTYKEFNAVDPMWKREGKQGNQWFKAEVHLPFERKKSRGTVNWIALVATVGTSYTSDMAVDDIEITQGRCVKERKTIKRTN